MHDFSSWIPLDSRRMISAHSIVGDSCSIVWTTILDLMVKYRCLLRCSLGTPSCTSAGLIGGTAVWEKWPLPAFINALGDRGAHIGSVLRYFQPNTLVKRSMDLPRFHLGLSSALYFNGFDGFSNAVHDQPFNEKPLTNVVLLYAWETECESREPFPWTLLNPIPIVQSFSRFSRIHCTAEQST